MWENGFGNGQKFLTERDGNLGPSPARFNYHSTNYFCFYFPCPSKMSIYFPKKCVGMRAG